VLDWTDVGTGLDWLARGYQIYTNFTAANAAADLRNRQAEEDARAREARAVLAQESADLEAAFLRLQGQAAHDIGFFNAGIFDVEAGAAISLAARDSALIADNAAIQRVVDLRSYASFQSRQVAAVGGSGTTLSGSSVSVMLDSAAAMDYTLATRAWAAQEAIRTRTIQGELQSWEAQVNAIRSRFQGDLQMNLDNQQADMTARLGALAAALARA